MKDRWINAGCEDDELKPFVEPELDISDQKRIGTDVQNCVCVPVKINSPSARCPTRQTEFSTELLKLLLE